jgi:hypothetical protein
VVPEVFSTADLPESFQALPADTALLRAVRASGLTLDRCEHGRRDCPGCTVAAARQLVAAAAGELQPAG